MNPRPLPVVLTCRLWASRGVADQALELPECCCQRSASGAPHATSTCWPRRLPNRGAQRHHYPRPGLRRRPPVRWPPRHRCCQPVRRHRRHRRLPQGRDAPHRRGAGDAGPGQAPRPSVRSRSSAIPSSQARRHLATATIGELDGRPSTSCRSTRMVARCLLVCRDLGREQ